MGLVKWLERQQERERLLDNAFSEELGISQSFWSLVRRGRRTGRSYLLVCAALRKYPDQWPSIVRAVAEDCGALESAA